ncbi:hypothetical protein ACHAXR_007676 [Thalassiosira sp. AJA248-18]
MDEENLPKSKCALCPTDAHTAMISAVLIGSLLLVFACYVRGKMMCQRRPRGRNNIINQREGPEVPRGDGENIVMSDNDINMKLRDIRRSQIVSCSLVTTKAIAASIRTSLSMDLSEKDSEATGRATNTEGPCSCTSLDSSSHTLCSEECIGDEEDGLQSAPDGSNIDSNIDSNIVGLDRADTCLILESTGWEIETCAICIEPYEENDAISYSKRQNCMHSFHQGCIKLWLKENSECPCCRCPYV